VNVQQGGLNDARRESDGATELFTQHSAGIYRYCLKRLRSREEAEDAVQATYLNAWRSLKRGFTPDNPRPWLFQIASNVCASTLRSKLSGTRLELHDPGELEDMVQVEQPARDAFLDLTEAVRDLPDRQRRALMLRDWQGLTYDEIAARMAVSDAAVETLLVRARGKVAATLASREWRPKLAGTARALLVGPLGLLPAKSVVAGKSALAAGSGHLKMGVVLACGTVAPLIAFGVLQTLVFGPEETKEANRTALSSPAIDVRPSASALESSVQVQAVDRRSASEPKDARTAKGHTGSGSRHQANQSSGHASTPVPASPSHPQTAGPPQQVTLCHETQSGERPGVTVSVAPQAAEEGLSQDPAGACG
jgi:RNA polymerase sigma factor (sigma-70 family)